MIATMLTCTGDWNEDLSHFSMGYGDFTSYAWFDEDPI